jgi:hypothetical protein
MIKALDSENFVDNVFCSHEARIQNVESLLETAHSVLENFDNSLLGLRHEYDRISEQLRDNLAKNGSLRKKDFDTMMGVLAADQDQRGREVRDLSRKYLSEQTQLVRELRRQLHDFTTALAEGEVAKVTEHHQAITHLFLEQRQRSDTVVTRLKESQEQQQQTAGMLKQLLAKGRELRTKDLKLMLAEFKRQRSQRLMEHGARREEVQDMREEVQDMLRGFRVQRVEAEQDRRSSCRGQTEKEQQP